MNKAEIKIGLAAALTGFFTFFTLTNTDIWWHLASAREMLVGPGFLREDPFSFTPSVEPWINVHWLYQLINFGFYNIAGVWGVLVFKTLVVCFSCFFLLKAFCKKSINMLSLSLFVLVLFSIRFEFLARPVLISLLCMSLNVFFMERWIADKKAKWIGLILLMQVFWANCQGLFVLGPFLSFAYFSGHNLLSNNPLLNKIKGIFFIPVLQFLLSAINPNGLKLLGYPFGLYGKINPSESNLYSQNISENIPLMGLWRSSQQYILFVVVGSSLILLLFMFSSLKNNEDKNNGLEGSVANRQLLVAHLIILLAFSLLAFISKRNVILFLFISSGLLAYYSSQFVFKKTDRKYSGLTLFQWGGFALAFALLGAGINHFRLLNNSPFSPPLSPFRYPVESVQILKKESFSGNIFNAARYGGYLNFHLYPSKKSFIDGRFVIKEPQFFQNYLNVLDNPQTFPQLQQSYEIEKVLIPLALFSRYQKLAHWLYQQKNWRLSYTNGTEALFSLNLEEKGEGLNLKDEATVNNIELELKNKWKNHPQLLQESLYHLQQSIMGLTSPN